MTNTDLKQQIESYLGKTFKFENSKFQLNEVTEKLGKFVLKTDRRTFVLTSVELQSFLEDISIVENVPFIPTLHKEKQEVTKPEKTETTTETIDLQIYTPTDTQKKIQDSLIAMLEKVQTNPEAIPQAKAVCDIANTMVNMEKNQINLMNAVKRKKS